MIDLTIDGVRLGLFANTYDAWRPIEAVYASLDDQYSGAVHWQIEDLDKGLYCNNTMPAAIWYASAETPSAFHTWLKLFGWSK